MKTDRSVCKPGLAAAWLPVMVSMALGGCERAAAPSAQAMQETPELGGTVWQVDDIDSAGIIDRSNVTIEFEDNTRIGGSASCNRYFGNLAIDASAFRVSAAGNSQMACVEALMRQEDRFLQALLDTRTYRLDGPVLLLFDAAGTQRIRAVRSAAPSQAQDVADPATAVIATFDCDDGLVVETRFVGPETLEMVLPDGKHILQRERSASGARYAADGLLFWNKGDEALLEIGGVEHHCRKS